MQGDQGPWPDTDIDSEAPGRDDDGSRSDHWDGRLTDADFADPCPPDVSPGESCVAEPPWADALRAPKPALYDGRPVRDPYDRGGGYRRVSDAVWAQARSDYLAGDAAETVCARHDLALSTLRARARTEGWRRQDQPDPEPVDLEIEAEAGLPDYADMARHALVRMNRAVLRGRSAEAAGWMRLHMRLLDLARMGDGSPPPPVPTAVADPAPARPVDPRTAALHRARTVQTLARAVSGLDPRNPVALRLIDMSVEMLEAMGSPSISDDSDDSDGVFPPGPSEIPPDG